MSKIILKDTASGELIFLLQPRNYTQLYNKLRSLLEPAEAALFSRPDVYSSSCIWSIETPESVLASAVKPFLTLSQQEKEKVSEKLSVLQDRILERLSQNKETAAIASVFFELPSAEDLFVYSFAGDYYPVFTRWATRFASVQGDVNPLTQMLEKYSLPVSEAVISFLYKNGTAASNLEFIFSFFNKESVLQTDELGIYSLGRLREGTTFSVILFYKEKRSAPVSFTVQAKKQYQVIVPVYIDGSVRVLDMTGNPVGGYGLRVIQGENRFETLTDEQGKSVLSAIETDADIEIVSLKDPAIKLVSRVSEFNKDFTLTLDASGAAVVHISVLDAGGIAKKNYPVLVSVENSATLEMTTGEEGMLTLGNRKAGEVIMVSDKNNPVSAARLMLVAGLNELVLRDNQPADNSPREFIRIKVVNHRDEPLKGISTDLRYRNRSMNFMTSQAGEFMVPKADFIDESKVLLDIRTQKLNKKGELIDVLHTKSFQYTSNKDYYTVKLGRKRNWWWLLLLLLPLLLLLRFEKTIYIKAITPDKKSVVADADVQLNYIRGYLYYEGRLFTRDSMGFMEKTGPKGVASFLKLKYSLYSYLFQHNSLLEVYASDECYFSDTVLTRFHAQSSGDTITLQMKYRTQSMAFFLIDRNTRQPLPGAKASIYTESGGVQYADSAFADAGGKVVFQRVPVCGNSVVVTGSHWGYDPYILSGYQINELGDDQNPSRILPLQRNPQFGISGMSEIYDGPLTLTPCDEEVKSGGQGNTNVVHQLGTKPGLITLRFEMLEKPDNLSITYKGVNVASTPGYVSYGGVLQWYYNPQPGDPQYCVVNINAPQDGTKWNYVLGCPQLIDQN